MNTKTKEFSYPTTKENVYTVYSGTGGVRLTSVLSRLLFAVYFGDFNIMLSSDVTNESRILYQAHHSGSGRSGRAVPVP